MGKFKTTLKEPVNNHSKEFEKKFNRTMKVNNINLNEDDLLTEKEQSLKKKIFSLSKMESLVFADPKLSAVYDEMAEDGEEKYGYHYNETIMNIIFNEYVLNSSKYLQKYKSAIPKKKKRRDKSGINSLKKEIAGVDDSEVKKDIDETTTTGVGVGAYETPFAWAGKEKKITKPIWTGGSIVAETDYLIDSNGFEKLFEELERNDLISDTTINEVAKSKQQQKFMGMVYAYKKGELKDDEVSDEVKKAAKGMSIKDVKDFAATKHDKLPEKVDEVSSMLNPDDTTMAMKPDAIGNAGNKVPTGTEVSGSAMNENDLDQIFEELEAFTTYHEKLQKMHEERRPSALVLKDRLGSQNAKNFKTDMKNSATGDVIKTEKDITWKDQQTEVGDNPYKLGSDIEKNSIKKTGDSLENVGDSANYKGNEIPKRNLTDDEQNQVDLYRLGMQDIKYDNEPGERFEERMKNDMGDDLYKQRQEKMEFRSKAPMYNKDTQPTMDSKKYDELNESIITGFYINELGKRKLIDFIPNEVKNVNENLDDLFKLDFAGLGNKYYGRAIDSKVIVNESIEKFINRNEFYTDGTNIFIKKISKNINESVNSSRTVNNENINKMKHLLGYNPSKFVDTKKVKKFRGF